MLRRHRKVAVKQSLKKRVVKTNMMTMVLKTARATINHAMMIVARFALPAILS